MSLTSLFLVPVDPLSTPDLVPVRRVFDELQIIAQETAPGVFAAGNGFSRHVVYAGCAPHLVMDPPADGSLQYCHVALHGPFAEPRLVTGPNTVRPRCPACRARFDDWRERLDGWRGGRSPARCHDCGKRFAATDLDWRHHAAAGRMLIEMRNVFPGEATPSDLLLHQLQAQTGVPWRYAWAACLPRA